MKAGLSWRKEECLVKAYLIVSKGTNNFLKIKTFILIIPQLRSHCARGGPEQRPCSPLENTIRARFGAYSCLRARFVNKS